MKNKLLKEIEEAFEVKYPTYGYILIAPTPKEAKSAYLKHIYITSGTDRVRIDSLSSYEFVFNMLHKHSWHMSLENYGDQPFFEPIAELLDSKKIRDIDLREKLKLFKIDEDFYFDKCNTPKKVLEELVRYNKKITPTFPSPEKITDLNCFFYEINWDKEESLSVPEELVGTYKKLSLGEKGTLFVNQKTTGTKLQPTSEMFKLLEELLTLHSEQNEFKYISVVEFKNVKKNSLIDTKQNLNKYLKQTPYKVSQQGANYALQPRVNNNQ